MKKVKIINSIAGVNFSFSAGQEVEITDELYKGIKAHCEIIKEAKTASKNTKDSVRKL